MRRNWWESGDWNAICDVCGFKRKASQLQQRWDGLMVCSPTVKKGCWEIRHPQEFIRPVPDQQKLPWTRPEATDSYLNYDDGCTASGRQGVAGYGTAGCAVAGLDLGIRDTLVEVEEFH